MDTAAVIRELFKSVPVTDQVAVFDRQSWSSRAKPFRRGDYCKVGLVLGTGRLHYANRGIAITRPALLFSNPLVPYSWEPLSAAQSGYFCLFTPQFVQAHYRDWTTQASPLFRLGADPVYFVDGAQQAYITAIYENMRRELSTDYPGRYDLVRHHLMLLLHEALKLQPATSYFDPGDSATRITSLFLTLLDRQFPLDSPERVLTLTTPADFARHLSVHVNSLNRAVRTITGQTTTAHITARILVEAQRLLQQTDWPIADIAYSLGFTYLTYFNNFFKKHTGQSPRACRQG